MLIHIHIRDLATIEELHLDLHHGTTMITGETGAGKSIFIEAIELALGARSSPTRIRPGKEKAEVNLNFDITHFPLVIEKLKNLDLYDEANECLIRRIISSDGRSRCYVNGTPATLPLLKELGDLLFHLHGQYDQQILFISHIQRDMLDRFAQHVPLATEVKTLAEAWKTLEQQRIDIQTQARERLIRRDYLRFQLEEFQTIKLLPDEWEKLEKEHHRLAHREALLQHLQKALAQLSQDNTQAILPLLNDLRKTFENIRAVESKAETWLSSINTAIIQLNELDYELQRYLENAELDPETLQAIENRMSEIFSLARKHKMEPPALFAFQENLSVELTSLEQTDDTLLALEKEQQRIAEKYHALADQLSQSRQEAAHKLAKNITTTIRALSLPHGEFNIHLEKETQALAAHGKEKIIFLIKTNPDQALQPLAKVISGGELSRLSLAVHLALASRTNIPTLVFDEVDTGLSGATAEKIGKLLQKLGQSYQVFCVTHQPQVAACGQHHLFVEKYFVKQTTHTRLRLLDTHEKTREIARMLGGEKITEKTLAHATEVLQGNQA